MKSLSLGILSEKLRFSCFSQVPTGSDYPACKPILPKILSHLDFYSPIFFKVLVVLIQPLHQNLLVKLLSKMMAVWTFAIFIAGLSYGTLYNIISKMPFATASFGIAILLIVLAAVLWIMDRKLNSLITNDQVEEMA